MRSILSSILAIASSIFRNRNGIPFQTTPMTNAATSPKLPYWMKMLSGTRATPCQLPFTFAPTFSAVFVAIIFVRSVLSSTASTFAAVASTF